MTDGHTTDMSTTGMNATDRSGSPFGRDAAKIENLIGRYVSEFYRRGAGGVTLEELLSRLAAEVYALAALARVTEQELEKLYRDQLVPYLPPQMDATSVRRMLARIEVFINSR